MEEPPSSILLAEVDVVSFDYFYLAAFLTIAVLLFFSALISASEVALFSIKADDLKRCRDSENPRDHSIARLLEKPRLLLATILIMNNLVNMGIVTLSTYVMWDFFSTRRPENIIVVGVTFSITFLIVFFGEIIPKVCANKYNLTYSRFVSEAWEIMQKVCKPLSWFLLHMGNFVERRFKKKGYSSTVKEIHQALELTAKNENATEEEKGILKGIVNYGMLTVKQVMKSRIDIFSVGLNLNFKELMAKVNESGFSRMPVHCGTLDKIEGILYIKDLLPYLNESDNFYWQKLICTGFFVPETKKLDSLLKDFQSKRVHMAIVVDEYGGTSGLVTLEDLIEEIIGEINDEFDDENEPFTKIDDNTFLFEGKTLLNDFCKVVNVNPSILDEVKGESESLGGLILELNNVMPSVADQITFDRFLFTIVSVDSKRIKRVRVFINVHVKSSES